MTVENLDQFVLDIDKFVEGRVPSEVLLIQKKLALEALRRLVFKTPRKTGRAAGNWQVELGASPEGERLMEDPIGEGLAKLAELDPYETVFIGNNVPYIEFLENGSSKQAPEGMVAVTVAELREMFE